MKEEITKMRSNRMDRIRSMGCDHTEEKKKKRRMGKYQKIKRKEKKRKNDSSCWLETLHKSSSDHDRKAPKRSSRNKEQNLLCILFKWNRIISRNISQQEQDGQVRKRKKMLHQNFKPHNFIRYEKWRGKKTKINKIKMKKKLDYISGLWIDR